MFWIMFERILEKVLKRSFFSEEFLRKIIFKYDKKRGDFSGFLSAEIGNRSYFIYYLKNKD